MRQLLGIMLALAIGLMAGSRAVQAHAVLLGTTPADRDALAAPPAEIALRFNESVTPISIRLIDRAGSEVRLPAPPQSIDRTVHTPLPPSLASGPYVVSWRVASADSHPVGGSFLFAVGPAPRAWQSLAVPTHDGLWFAATAANGTLHFAGLLFAVGAALYLLLVTPRDATRWTALRSPIVAAAALAIATAALAIGLQGAALGDLAPESLLSADPWRIGAASSRGLASAIAAMGAILIAAGIDGSASRLRRCLMTVGAALATGSTILTGHAAATTPGWLVTPIVLGHVVVAAFWLGSLLALSRTLASRSTDALGPIRRFSLLAVVAVPLLVLAGAGLAIIQVEDPAALIGTSYGLLLSGKIALVAAMLALASWNRWVLTARLAAGADGVRRSFRRTIGLELACGIAVLGVTAVLSQTIPPRALADAAAHAGHEHGTHDGHRDAPESFSAYVRSHGRAAVIEVGPAVAGRNGIAVGIVDGQGRRVNPIEVTVEIGNKSLGIEPMLRRMTVTPGGGFSYVGPEFSVAGSWTLRVDALISDFEKITFETVVPIRRDAGSDQSPNSSPIAR